MATPTFQDAYEQPPLGAVIGHERLKRGLRFFGQNLSIHK